MRVNEAKERLANGKAISVVSAGYNSPELIEFLGGFGFDAMYLDTEHTSTGWESLQNMIRAADLVETPTIVRVQDNSPSLIARTLTLGAYGVQVPHISSREEAEAAVRATKFYPIGDRGWSAGRAGRGENSETFADKSNKETMIVAMIEDADGVKNIDDILKVGNIDAYFIGRGDLAQSLGYPGQNSHPKVVEAADHAIDAIIAAGGVVAIGANSPAALEKYLERGMRYFNIGLRPLMAANVKEIARLLHEA